MNLAMVDLNLLVSLDLASLVRFRVKDQSWFVSDTMDKDIWWTLEQLDQMEELKVWLFFLYHLFDLFGCVT